MTQSPNGNGNGNGNVDVAAPPEPPRANGAKKPTARVTGALVAAAAERLGEFSIADLAAELGTDRPDSLRQHAYRLRDAGRLEAAGLDDPLRAALAALDERARLLEQARDAVAAVVATDAG